jgi:hypothetical protein
VNILSFSYVRHVFVMSYICEYVVCWCVDLLISVFPLGKCSPDRVIVLRGTPQDCAMVQTHATKSHIAAFSPTTLETIAFNVKSDRLRIELPHVVLNTADDGGVGSGVSGAGLNAYTLLYPAVTLTTGKRLVSAGPGDVNVGTSLQDMCTVAVLKSSTKKGIKHTARDSGGSGSGGGGSRPTTGLKIVSSTFADDGARLLKMVLKSEHDSESAADGSEGADGTEHINGVDGDAGDGQGEVTVMPECEKNIFRSSLLARPLLIPKASAVASVSYGEVFLKTLQTEVLSAGLTAEYTLGPSGAALISGGQVW